MKRLLLVVALVALAAAPAASAKEIQSLAVCGASGCEEISHNQSAEFIAVFEGGNGSGGGAQTVLGAVPVGPYYKIGVRIRGDQTGDRYSFTTWFVPPDLLHLSDPGAVGFKRLPSTFAAVLSRAAQSVRPYAAPRVVSAYVGDKKALNPAQYINLFRNLPVTDATLDDTSKWVNITLTPNRANPWISDGTPMIYSYGSQALFLVKPVKIDDDLARTIARDGGLPAPSGSGGGWGRPVGIGLLIGFVPIALAILFFVTRRRQQPGTATA